MSGMHTDALSLTLGGNRILRKVSLDLKEGEMLGLIGPNGAGKSSLLKIIAGITPSSNGAIYLDQVPLGQLKADERARIIAYLTQEGTAHWPISVERIVALGRLPHLGNWQSPGSRDREVIRRVMEETDLLTLAERALPTLSGGERARVLLARALAVEPRILLTDEPVAALDLAHQLEVMDLLRQHCRSGGSVIVVLHDLRLAAHYCDRLQLLLNGETLAVGPATEVITPENLLRAYGVKMRDGEQSIAEAFSLSWSRSNPGRRR